MTAFRPVGPRSPHASNRWIDRWLAACSELAELERSNPMTDAVIDEIDGRMIRIGDQWLADFASCNYLGFDLDREIIAAVPEYIERWGTHPSWSRMLGSPVLYPQIEERADRASRLRGRARHPDDHADPPLGDPRARRRRDDLRRQPRAQDDLRRLPVRVRARGDGEALPLRGSRRPRAAAAAATARARG